MVPREAVLLADLIYPAVCSLRNLWYSQPVQKYTHMVWYNNSMHVYLRVTIIKFCRYNFDLKHNAIILICM